MICFDTMILIWGVQGASREDQREMIDRTRRFIGRSSRDGEQIMVPTPVLAEYLQHFGSEQRLEQLALFEKNFFLPAFDLRAAVLAAELAHTSRGLERPAEISRQAVKTDIQILATAIAHGANRLVTGEAEHFARLAGDHDIRIMDVPSIAEQTPLEFDD